MVSGAERQAQCPGFVHDHTGSDGVGTDYDGVGIGNGIGRQAIRHEVRVNFHRAEFSEGATTLTAR